MFLKESSWLVGNTAQREPFIGEAMRRLERSEQCGDSVFMPNPGNYVEGIRRE